MAVTESQYRYAFVVEWQDILAQLGRNRDLGHAYERVELEYILIVAD